MIEMILATLMLLEVPDYDIGMFQRVFTYEHIDLKNMSEFNGTGDCTEWSLILCEVAHRKGFNTRYVLGRATQSNGNIGLHAWCEFGNETNWYIPDSRIFDKLIAYKSYKREQYIKWW